MNEKARSWIQVTEISFNLRVAGRTLRERVRSSVPRVEFRATAPAHKEKPVDVARATILGASWMLTWRSVSELSVSDPSRGLQRKM